MDLIIDPTGQASCIYDETIDLAMLGPLSIRRARMPNRNDQGQWTADLIAPSIGPQLGPFEHRSAALAAEVAWLEAHWLQPRLKKEAATIARDGTISFRG